MRINSSSKELIACFLEEGFKLDFEQTAAPAKKTLPASDRAASLEENLYQQYLNNRYKMLFYFGFVDDAKNMSPSISFLHKLAAKFIARLSQNPDLEYTREQTIIAPTNDDILDILRSVPFAVGIEFINANWIQNIYRNLSGVFAAEIAAYPGSVADFLRDHNSRINVAGRVFFHLVENKSAEYPFAFLATYSTGDLHAKTAVHMPLKNALLEYKGQNEMLLKLLSTVSKAAQQSDFISELVESGELFSPLKFTSQEAYTFLKEIPLYEECGILCRIPDWWKKKTNSIKLSLKVGEQAPAMVGVEALLSFQAELFLGDDKITEEEIKALLAQTSGLSFIKGKWVEVDHAKLQATLEAYERAKKLAEKGAFSMAEAMRLQLHAHTLLDIEEEEVSLEVSNGGWLKSVTAKLTNPSLIENTPPGAGFKAMLRPYQQKGFDWLRYMRSYGFGACLADDMGLGKTVQVIALLEHIRSQAAVAASSGDAGKGNASVTNANADIDAGKSGKPLQSLLIIPASLMGNWQKEIEKFAPSLKYKLIYNKKDQHHLHTSDGTDLFITTYGMAVRLLEELKKVSWELLILDEAQAIKNPATKQAKAVKQLQAKARIALTGTPIENRLSDLWSLFDFLNAGLLGTSKEFSAFTKRLKENGGDYGKLRAVVSPFILRRLKTDKTIIPDLPDKLEVKAYANLTKKQAVLYNGVVKELEHKLETGAEGIERKGLILSTIMKCKQICNHPDQFLGQTGFKPEHSGKFARLFDICETIAKKRERVLVFTQFREMTEPIAAFLETIFMQKGLVMHGGVPAKKRLALVEEFCDEAYVPFMVLSLKAGGVGLNLTAANHVIHFDRWWNPAVEDQATDRAFRIGQEKNVMVHKMITAGTIEEKIDLMIEEKSKLANDIIAASGESWITELDNNQLMELFTLVQAGEV
ncbi:MAG: DEAD/DEAH box helicase [Firmicutes bacterium]|nr:DEAD/DEAH box helicase [Bacillota bacterium]